MTAVKCRNCDKDFDRPLTGRRPLYCSGACRVAALRKARAAKPARPDVSATPRNETLQRPSGAPAPGLGDGDWCPQDDGHGRMYFMKPAMTRQWCPSSRHLGDAFYQRDGVTPAPRPAPAEPASNEGAHQRQPDQERTEVPADASPGASTPSSSNQPSPARAPADPRGGALLQLPLAAAP